jgi:formate hydrogenlyase subunit 3/multisubunit Na+/H+ antiporter MnhD subunit
MLPALLAVQHDATRMEDVYFWSALLIALTPIVIFGALGVWVGRKWWRERRPQRGTPNAERGTERQI